MVDVFRAAPHALPIVEEALTLKPRPSVIWMQLGVRNDEAAAKAEAAGMKVVMNRCPKIEYGRLSSEIGWIGVNSRTISSKKAQLLGKGVQRMSLNRTDHGRRRDRGRAARAGGRSHNDDGRNRTQESGLPSRLTPFSFRALTPSGKAHMVRDRKAASRGLYDRTHSGLFDACHPCRRAA